MHIMSPHCSLGFKECIASSTGSPPTAKLTCDSDLKLQGVKGHTSHGCSGRRETGDKAIECIGAHKHAISVL